MWGAPEDLLVLALDTGSPLVSVALGRGERILAARAAAMERSAGQLLAMVGEVLAAAGARPADLAGIVALAGPGSFTGLRIGLATALGWHQALGLPALALPTLRVLAAQGGEHGGGMVVAAVDALRGEWSVQRFTRGALPASLGEMELVHGDVLARTPGPGEGRVVIGFGVTGLRSSSGAEGAAAADGADRGDGTRGRGITATKDAIGKGDGGVHLREPGPLAPTALRLAAALPLAQWDAAALASPIYSRPPAVTLPRRPARAGTGR